MEKISRQWMAGVVISALAYAGLFYINAWLTAHLIYGLGVNWIYLPAGLRLLLTLIFGLPAALGIAISSFVISYSGDFSQEIVTCIGIGLISGFAPYLAKILVLTNIQLQSDLSNLNIQRLLACILIYSLLSAGLHQWWFVARGLDETGSIKHFLVMLIGDVLGTVVLIGLIKFALDLMKPSKVS